MRGNFDDNPDRHLSVKSWTLMGVAKYSDSNRYFINLLSLRQRQKTVEGFLK